MRDKHIVAAFDANLRGRLEATILPEIGQYIGHGLLGDASFDAHPDTEQHRLEQMLKSAYLLTVAVSGSSGEEVRAIAAAEKADVACGVLLFTEQKWIGETLPYLSSKYAFIYCVHDDGCSMGPVFSRLISYPTSINHTYNFGKSYKDVATTIVLAARDAKDFGRNVPPIHERPFAPIRHPYAGNMGD